MHKRLLCDVDGVSRVDPNWNGEKGGDKRGCGDTKRGDEAREDVSLPLVDPRLTLIGLAYM